LFAIINIAFITLAWMFKIQANKMNQTPIPSTKVIEQVPADWDAVPFVDVTVSDFGVCSYGQSPIFEKKWGGLLEGCLYTGKDQSTELLTVEDILSPGS